MVSGDKNPVRSEEGFAILPDITYEEFCVEEYDCLILPGCSDIRQSIRDEKLMEFLRGLEGNETFPIGAICAGPIYLAKAGLLKDKKFTNSMYLEMNERLPFIDMENIRYQPVVEDLVMVLTLVLLPAVAGMMEQGRHGIGPESISSPR